MSRETASSPGYLQVHPLDTVAIVVNEGVLPAGAKFPSGLKTLEDIPEGHKVALADMDPGAPILRYGEIIGFADRFIRRGSWVNEDAMRLPAVPALDGVSLVTRIASPMPPLDGYGFEGFLNADGSVGSKNILGITTTVQCVAPAVEFAAQRIKSAILPRYPNVDDVVALTHTYGCGVAIEAPGSEIPIRTLRNLCLNPNLGGESMVVSLGCEKLQPVRVLSQDGLPVLHPAPNVIRMQDEQYRSFDAMIAAMMEMAEKRLAILDRRRRTPRPASDLVVGLQCGGSDAFSGITANPAVGYASDLLVRAGATVMFSEVTEVRDAVHLLAARAVNEDVARRLVEEMAWYDEYLARGGVDRSANPTPGNKAGGLSNVVEKALGSVAKAGTSPISGVFGPGERVNTKGLVFAATPASDFICGTLQLAASMNMHVFTTGRGTPYGLAMAPVVKVASRSALARRWQDLIDIDAGTIATGAATVEQVGMEIFRFILDVASGRKQTCADRLGLHNDLALFNPAPVT